MSSLKPHYEYDFVRRGVAPDAIQTLLRGASDAQLYAVGNRVLTAQTLEETLSGLDRPGSATTVTEPGRDINA